MDLNKLAADICAQEGGKVNLTIAQVKEVLSITLREIAKYPICSVIEAIERTAGKTFIAY